MEMQTALIMEIFWSIIVLVLAMLVGKTKYTAFKKALDVVVITAQEFVDAIRTISEALEDDNISNEEKVKLKMQAEILIDRWEQILASLKIENILK